MRSPSTHFKWRPLLALILLTSAACQLQVAQASSKFSQPHQQPLAKNKYNCTSNLVRHRRATGFVPFTKGQGQISKITATRKSLISLPMSASSRQLRLDDSIEEKLKTRRGRGSKNLKSYSLNNHQYIHSIAMRQTRGDNDSKEAKIQRYRGGDKKSNAEKNLTLPSSVRGEDMEVARNTIRERLRHKLNQIDVQDAAVVLAYSCTMFAISLPVVLIPMIAADPFGTGSTTTVNSAEFLGTLVSLSTLGAGIGKIFNGFICQAIGGRLSGSIYLLSLAVFSVILSTTNTIHGYAIAGMEFSSSMMWTACSVLMAERYASDGKKFAAGITSLSLASTTGTLIAKVAGGALLSQFHWRQVCLLSAVVASLGSGILYFLRDEQVKEVDADAVNGNAGAIELSSGGQSSEKSGPSLGSIGSTVSRVLGNRMFYSIALAHFGAFIVRTSEKVIGAFLADTTELPRYLCGSLTTSVTLGFVLGLIKGRDFEDLDSISEKKAFVFKRYSGAALSAVAIAILANKEVGAMLGQYVYAGAITILTGVAAALVGYQFYQLPSKYATSFGKDKAVYISFNDGICFLALSPFWPKIIGIAASSEQGWTQSWLIIAGFIAAGGAIMTKSLEKVVGAEADDKK